jgi:hypothetical protein
VSFRKRPSSQIYLLAGTALIALAGVFFLARDTQASYAGQLASICKRAYEPLRTASGNYFENVVTISTLKRESLASLASARAQGSSPPAHQP